MYNLGNFIKNKHRELIKMLIDLFLLNVALVISIFLKYDLFIYLKNNYILLRYNIIFLIFYLIFRMSKTSWRFTGLKDILNIFILSGITNIFFAISNIIAGTPLNLTIYIENILILIFLMTLARGFLVLSRLRGLFRNKLSRENVLIYGAGEAGVLLAKEENINPNFSYRIIGFIDDSPAKKNNIVYGKKILGTIEELKDIVEKYEIKKLIVAMPSLSKQKISEILTRLNKIEGISVKILPYMDSLLENRDLSSQLRNIKIEDLLGREEVKIDSKGIAEMIEGKTIFITGGAGSIGSELSRQLLKFNPKKIIILEINENQSYILYLELKRQNPYSEINIEIVNIRDKEKLEYIFNKYKPELLFHAAAHKHVPLMENNPEEAVKNNIFGTKNIVECCIKFEVEKAILISTDKAVNPTNVMGATKRVCEMIFQKANEKNTKTKFAAVRFGNVLGSNGSVIPIFSKLIEEGRNLTLTHRDIVRFFMSIPEAAQLVIQAATFAKGGEIFILDMGEPVKIYDLAKNMIKLSGSNVGIDIIGLRPGEKLYEELLYDVNASTKTENNKIFITNMENEKVSVDIEKYYEILFELSEKIDVRGIRKTLAEIIGTFKGKID